MDDFGMDLEEFEDEDMNYEKFLEMNPDVEENLAEIESLINKYNICSYGIYSNEHLLCGYNGDVNDVCKIESRYYFALEVPKVISKCFCKGKNNDQNIEIAATNFKYRRIEGDKNTIITIFIKYNSNVLVLDYNGIGGFKKDNKTYNYRLVTVLTNAKGNIFGKNKKELGDFYLQATVRPDDYMIKKKMSLRIRLNYVEEIETKCTLLNTIH